MLTGQGIEANGPTEPLLYRVALFQSSMYEIGNSRGPVVNYLKKYCAINLA